MKGACLVYGWKIGPEHFENALTCMTEEALATGLRIVFARDAKRAAFAGRPLLRLASTDEADAAGAALPAQGDAERLREGMRLAGMQAAAAFEPLVWLVAE